LGLLKHGAFAYITDNSGAKVVKILNGYIRYGASTPGELLMVLVKKVAPHKKVKRGEKLKALLVQTRLIQKRLSGYAKASFNLVILLKKGEKLPIANRIHCRVFIELRLIGYFRVILISRGFV